MLVDPLPVKSLSLAAGTAITVLDTDSYALVDLAPGRTVRKCSALNSMESPGTLTIAHSVSKENGAVATDRSLIRLDISGLGPSAGVTGDMKAFAYLVIGVPRGAYDMGDTAFNTLLMVEKLLGVFVVSPTTANLSGTNLARIIAGEP